MPDPEQPAPDFIHLGQVRLSPDRHAIVKFGVTDEAGDKLDVQAVLRDGDQQIEGSDHVLAVSSGQDSQGKLGWSFTAATKI